MLGVPSNDFGGQEPGGKSEIHATAQGTYHVTFPITEKVAVKGKDAHPFFRWAAADRPRSAARGSRARASSETRAGYRTAPPLTRTVCPVMKPAAGDASQQAAAATSSGNPHTPSGVSRRTRSCHASDAVSPQAVRTHPGAMQFTRTSGARLSAATCAAVAMARPKTGAILMLVAAAGGFLAVFTAYSAAALLLVIAGILALFARSPDAA